MSLVLLDIPSDPAAWPEWLERQLVGLDLADLVDQLEMVVDSASTQTPSLGSVCGAALTEVLQQGLSAFQESQVRSLLRHPRLLLELQEKILVEGGQYWRNLPTSITHSTRVAIQRKRMDEALEGSPRVVPLAKVETTPREQKREARTFRKQFAAAAMILLAVTATWLARNQGGLPGWGFDKPGLLTAQVPDEQYLGSLADAAQAWFNKRPADSAALAARLEQFRHGCDTLLKAPHPQLNDADRAWLMERCGVWKGKLEGHLSDARTGNKPLEQIQREADTTVNALINALRTRATAAA